MTAQEARAISDAKKLNTEQIMPYIESMAEAGNNYASFDPIKILDAELSKKELIELGYAVVITSSSFKITW